MTSTATISPDRAVNRAVTRPWRPRITHPRQEIDPVAAEQAAADLLTALGLDLTAENLAETPRRMALALIEMTSGSDFELTTFPNDEEYDELVLVRDIPVQSVCEHHVLPFVGLAQIGYLPGDRILGLSKFARMVDLHARRPQTQERLTKRIADHLQGELHPRGVGVVIEAEHLCMMMRGVQKQNSSTTASSMLGVFKDNQNTRSEFLNLVQNRSR